MAYDDGYYYGQCKIVCEAEDTIDNGKTVSIVSGEKSWSKAIANKTAEFLVPGRDRYTVSLLDGEVTKWSGIIEAGYGECIHVMLADGYTPVIKKDFDAQLTTSNGVPFRFGYDAERDRYGYIREIGGAEVVFPFSSGFCYALKAEAIRSESSASDKVIDVKQYLIDNKLDDIIDYRKLKTEDFLLEIRSINLRLIDTYSTTSSHEPSVPGFYDTAPQPMKTYNSETGKLTVSIEENKLFNRGSAPEAAGGGYAYVFVWHGARYGVMPWLFIHRPL